MSQGDSAVVPPRPQPASRPDGPGPAAGDLAVDLDDGEANYDGDDLEDADGDDAEQRPEPDDDRAAGAEAGSAEQAAGSSEDQAESDQRQLAELELEGEIAADYIEALLDVADLDGDIDMDVDGDRAVVSVVGATLEELVGPRGQVLEALQELTRLAVHRQTGGRSRIMVDIGGYRIRRRAELARAGQEAAEEVKLTGAPKKLGAMNPFERKVVHDAVAAAGLRSESEGEEPDRRVVVLPAG